MLESDRKQGTETERNREREREIRREGERERERHRDTQGPTMTHNTKAYAGIIRHSGHVNGLMNAAGDQSTYVSDLQNSHEAHPCSAENSIASARARTGSFFGGGVTMAVIEKRVLGCVGHTSTSHTHLETTTLMFYTVCIAVRFWDLFVSGCVCVYVIIHIRVFRCCNLLLARHVYRRLRRCIDSTCP